MANASQSDGGKASDTWSEDDVFEESNIRPAGSLDTMMFDEVIDADSSKCFSVAPSEGNMPIGGTNNCKQ